MPARGGSAAPARRQNCARRMIRTEVVGAVDGEQIRQPGACTIDPALDRSHRAIADGGRLLIREAPCADEDERYPLVRREAPILVGASGFPYEEAAAICD